MEENPEQPLLREATESDAAALVALRQAFFDSQIAAGLLDIPEDMVAMLARTTPNLIRGKRNTCLVAPSQGGLVGYIFATIRIVPGASQSAVGSIEETFVADDHRGGGLAAELCRQAIGALKGRGAERIQLRVLSGNAGARAFWARMGFSENVAILEYDGETGQGK